MCGVWVSEKREAEVMRSCGVGWEDRSVHSRRLRAFALSAQRRARAILHRSTGRHRHSPSTHERRAAQRLLMICVVCDCDQQPTKEAESRSSLYWVLVGFVFFVLFLFYVAMYVYK